MTGLDAPALAAALRPAVAANVMTADTEGYAFRHELIREAVREDLLPGERAQAAQAFAQALEADPALSGDGMVAVRLALYWREANEHERALAAAWEAAADAAARFAFAEQLQMLEQVLELWDRVPEAAERTGADRAGVIERAADAAHWTGEPDRGLTLVEAALGEVGEAADASRRASLLLRRSLLRQEELLPGPIEDARAALRLARRPDRLRVHILGQLIRLVRDQREEAEGLAGELLALDARLGDPECHNEALLNLTVVGIRSDDLIAALRAARESARRSGSGRLELRAYGALTHLLEGRGEYELAVQAGRDGLDRARQIGLARYTAVPVAANLAESLTSVGHWDEALEVLDEVLGLDPTPRGRAFLLVLRGLIAAARGDDDTAARIVQQLRRPPVGTQAESQLALPIVRLAAEVQLAQGDLAGAFATGRIALTRLQDSETRYLWPLLATAMRACAEAVTMGVPQEADAPDELRPALELAAAGLAVDGPVERAHAAVFAAEASRAAGQPDLAAWDGAADAWESLGQPYRLAYALLRAAGAAAAGGHRDAAATRLQRAAELAGQLRAGPLLQDIGQLARRARVEITGRRSGAALPFGLTERELEVLRLVTAGRGNREIAAELFISPKTASVHVSNILGKLHVASRGEAAAAAHRLHIFDPP